MKYLIVTSEKLNNYLINICKVFPVNEINKKNSIVHYVYNDNSELRRLISNYKEDYSKWFLDY